jgi:hypothetical protein
MLQVFDEASNRADLVFDISATDADTGDAIVFTGVSVVYGLKDQEGCMRATGSTTEGSIVLVDQYTLEITVLSTTMRSLQVGTYQMGVVATLNSSPVQIAIITIPVYDGCTP